MSIQDCNEKKIIIIINFFLLFVEGGEERRKVLDIIHPNRGGVKKKTCLKKI